MGPLKIIGDGSMGTRTAWCCEPYAGVRPDDEHPCGAPNQSVDQMEALLRRAHAAGLEVAVHAIGDRANQAALDAFAAWLAIAVAVHRSGDDRPAWHCDEALTPLQALAASVDGGRLAPGARGDVVVLGADPLDAANLLDMPVRVTVCASRVTHREA